MFSILYKTLHHRQVEGIPRGLSRSTIIQAFHQHQLMIRALYPGFQITATHPIDSDTTAFSVRNPESDVLTKCSLANLDDGLGAEIEVGLGMKIVCQWTIHSWNEDEDSKISSSIAKQTEENTTTARRRITLDLQALNDIYLVEETTFILLKPFDRWAQTNRDRSKALEHILVLLRRLESGETEI
ncbi:hypothetical protein BDV27DRAFT_134297 [Aspergillus caelatus]|uniref:Uncharacterized protein n=1 Tax=Aspergillus caelatus TaxID=61420 RepID=A0A5N6ZSK7_9EURO|nr:uncharacterized protein BDV27DRAFT_134297 [Aspergillus caelatus]KAE8360587.1 hypothetical protein BDV27DRAFT_134297 [Aspergillus caelatus]